MAISTPGLRRLIGFWPRALLAGMLFGLLSCISVIHPRARKMPADTVTLSISPADSFIGKGRLELHGATLRRWLGVSLGVRGAIPPLPLPDIDDIVVFCYGIPVVPWLKRVGAPQWRQWIERVGEVLRAQYPDRGDVALGQAWNEWVRLHIRYVETHFARVAGQRLAQLVCALPPGPGGIYIVGHSAGASAVLQYLADLRERMVPEPARRIRVALSLDAAVTGIARAWTGWPTAPEGPSSFDRLFPRLHRYLKVNGQRLEWRRYLRWARDFDQHPYRGLGAWARDRGMTILTVSNSADTFTHGPLDDLPFLGLKIGRRFDLRGLVTGKTHLCVQRDPRVAPFLWWHDDAMPRL